LAKDTQAVIIPSTIHDVIMARVDMLPDAAKQVLQTGSVAGKEFSHELIMKVTGLREQKMLSHLSVLKNSELIYERGIYPQSTYVFKHALTQELIYDNLLLKRKKVLHVKIGMAIERIYPERLEEFYEMLAYHYSKTDNLKKAYQYLNLSGEKALRNYSNWEAFRFYKKAIKVLQELSEIEESKGEQIKIQLLISIAIGRMGYPEGSLEILLKGEKLAKELGDTKSLATFYSRLCHYHTIRGGDPQLGIKYGEKCFKEAEGVQDIELMAPIACDLCSACFVSGKFIKTIDMASEVLALLEKEQRKNDFFGTRYIVFSGLSAYCGFAHGIVGNFDKGNSLFEDGLLYSREVNDLYGLGFLKFMQGSVFLWKGDGKRTIAHVQESIRYLKKGQGFLILGLSCSTLGAGYFLLGDLETAQKQIQNGLKIQNDHGVSFYLSLHYCFLSDVYLASGDIKNAQVCIEEALKFSQQNKEKHIEGMSWAMLGRILGKRDIAHVTKAEEYIIKGTDILEKLSLKPWANQGHLFLGHLYADTGQKEKALEHLNMAKDQFQKMGMDYWLNKTLKAFERF
jgi:tetratricopeptide (TPR) repeat protein